LLLEPSALGKQFLRHRGFGLNSMPNRFTVINALDPSPAGSPIKQILGSNP
jgi:hypothetical protein